MLNEMGVLVSLRCGQHLRILQDKKFPIVACIPKVLPYAEHKDVNTLHAWPGTPLYEPHSSLQSIPLECDLPSKAITFSHT